MTMDSHNAENMEVDPTRMYELIQEGQELHSQLAVFTSALHVSTSTQDISVAWMYYHALSIYLSGVFDYTLSEVCAIPSLRDDEILVHLEGILKRSDKTYNRRDSQMVTHSSTSRPVQCLCMAERTGCPVFTDLWSYSSVTTGW